MNLLSKTNDTLATQPSFIILRQAFNSVGLQPACKDLHSQLAELFEMNVKLIAAAMGMKVSMRDLQQ